MTRLRRALIPLALVLPLVPAVPAQARSVPSITVGGRILNPDGSPAVGAKVSLSYTPGFFAAITALASLGTVCAVSDICDGSNVRVKTDSKGRWRMRLVKDGHLAREGNVVLAVVGKAGDGLSTKVAFQRRSHTLGDLHLWDGHLSLSPAVDHQVVPDWDDLPDGDGAEPSYTLQSEDVRGHVTTQLFGVGSEDPQDDRLWQSGDRQLVVLATAQQDGYGKVTYRSRALAFHDLGTPLSRGRTARRTKADGTQSKPAPRWTDGDRGVEVDTQGRTSDKGVTIDLGSVRTVSAVTIDECTFSCTVSTSVDGRSWVDFADLGSDHQADVVAVGVPVPARFVRWTSEFSIDYTDGRELSVW